MGIHIGPKPKGMIGMGSGVECNGKLKTMLVHRLVTKAFILNPNNKPHTNHKNGIKSDNRAVNLEHCTRSENNKHAFRTGLNKPVKGEKHYHSKLQLMIIRGQ